MPTSSMSPGTVLGERYRLEDLLSEHDGARFWRATDVVLARSVAVHVVASEDPRAAALLEAARLSVTVTDAHFLRVLDCDDVDGVTWVINEWGEGDSLDVMLEQGPLPAARAAWLAHEVAEAVVAAHAAGIAHGRLNPEAVMVTDAGAVKVIGFVVYAAFAGPGGRDTSFGVVGDRDADAIDLAGILYAALTGRWPGITGSSVPRAPREGRRPLRPRQVRAGVPRTLDAICDRVLNREASQHAAPLSTAFEIAAALSDYLGDPAAAAPLDLPAMHTEPEADVAPDVTPDVEPVATEPPPIAPSVPTSPTSVAASEPVAASAEPAPEPDRTMPSAFGDLDPHELAGDEEWEPAPPPPPFEQVAERPLFAEHDRRVPAGAPAVEPAPDGGWFFTDEAGNDASGAAAPRSARRSTWLWVLLAALLVVAMYVAFDLGRSDDPDEPGATPPTSSATPTDTVPTGTPIKVVRATDFDPEGDPPSENPGQAKFAVDGKPGTSWKTLAYRDDPHLGGLKSGVGLVLDLGTQSSVGSIELDLVGAGTSYEIWATPPGVNEPPVELADLRRITGQTAAGSPSVARFETAVRTRYLLVWLTELPAVSGGRFRGEISEAIPRP